jgi:hypothetical protein
MNYHPVFTRILKIFSENSLSLILTIECLHDEQTEGSEAPHQLMPDETKEISYFYFLWQIYE